MKNFLLFCVVFFAILINVGCPRNPVSPHPTPVVTDTNMCVEVETHLTQMCNANPTKNAYCCQVSAPTKKGKSYTQFCIEKQNQGVFLNPKCVSQVTSCDQIDQCTQSE